MIQLRPRETVILADDVGALSRWYRDVLGFEIVREFDEDYEYVNLETASGILLGIADAEQMGVSPTDRGQNTVLLQFEVDDVEALFERLKEHGGTGLFGPSYDEVGGFWFGGFADLEGNPCWVVDANCP